MLNGQRKGEDEAAEVNRRFNINRVQEAERGGLHFYAGFYESDGRLLPRS